MNLIIKVLPAGGWNSNTHSARSTSRGSGFFDDHYYDVGFRIIRNKKLKTIYRILCGGSWNLISHLNDTVPSIYRFDDVGFRIVRIKK